MSTSTIFCDLEHCQPIFKELKGYLTYQCSKAISRNCIVVQICCIIINSAWSKLLDSFVFPKDFPVETLPNSSDDHTCGRSLTWDYSSKRKSSCHPVVHSHRPTHSPLDPCPQYSCRKCWKTIELPSSVTFTRLLTLVSQVCRLHAVKWS